jgi:hypothetical protein
MTDDLDMDDLETIADEIDSLVDRLNQTMMNYETEYESNLTLTKLQEAKAHLLEAEDKVRFLL